MQQGGSQYGVPPPPEMAPFSPTGTAAGARAHVLGISDHLQQQQPAQQLAEVAAPISSRPPAPAVGRMSNYDELAPAGSGNFPDEDALAAGEEVERGVPGNRWPRQETLALLKIRSEMDAVFRDATLKGPLWEDVSRKLAELGYTRSSKKCKEKFENVHKYYKRTKEGRAGRQDGKSYRFFSQLEALHSGGAANTTPSTDTLSAVGVASAAAAAVSASPTNPTSTAPIGFTMAGSSGRIQPTPLASAAPSISAPRVVPEIAPEIPGSAAGISFSSNTSSSAYSDSDDEGTEEGQPAETRKRKRRGSGGGGGGGSRKMMAFFEGLMKQVMERQEAMQQRFLETIEKREQDRMIREEAWKRQEMARVAKEHEAMAQERAFSASRDAAIIGFLQKITGQTVQFPPSVTASSAPLAVPVPVPVPVSVPPPLQHSQQQQAPPCYPQPQPQPQQVLQLPQEHHLQVTEINATSSEIVPFQEPQEAGIGVGMDPASSRWPKSEVLALIKLRSGLEFKYQEAGPKGPLWEEISSGMRRMGFNRNSKRCKEKWENINKYFKKVKESNKKRPEDAKTCPYFHQLDALYRKKVIGGGGAMVNQSSQEQEISPNPTNPQEIRTDVLTIIAPPPLSQPQPPPPQPDNIKNGNGNGNRNGGNSNGTGEGSIVQVQTSNGGLPMSFFGEGNGGGSAGAIKKPEGIVKELREQQQPPPPLQRHRQAMVEDYDKLEELADSDNIDQDEDEENEDDEDRKMDYKIQFQRQNVNGKPSSGGNPSAAATAAAAAAAGSFLAMVQ